MEFPGINHEWEAIAVASNRQIRVLCLFLFNAHLILKLELHLRGEVGNPHCFAQIHFTSIAHYLLCLGQRNLISQVAGQPRVLQRGLGVVPTVRWITA